MDHIDCTVERVTFHNEENGYSVLKCNIKNMGSYMSVIGIMPGIHDGASLTADGEWENNKKYGIQFHVKTYEEKSPATIEGIKRYLGSGAIKGVGPTFAIKIVEKFGLQTLEVLENEPEKLLDIPGIGNKKLLKVIESWKAQKEIRNIMIFLQGLNLSTSIAGKIFKQYGKESISVIKENPYRLADEVWGIGFKTADAIAMSLGYGHEKYVRLRSGLIYTLNQLSNEGHCFMWQGDLAEKAAEILEVEEYLLYPTMDEMIREGSVIIEKCQDEDDPEIIKKAVYLPAFYHSERGTAFRLNKIASSSPSFFRFTDNIIDSVIAHTGKKYDEIQEEAIIKAVESKIMILTGGPGTGKTTTVLGIISAFQELGADILLAAPTGRAAKRLSEATGMPAKTIHRLLEIDQNGKFKHNEHDKLEGDILILDECSMIDIVLMYNLLKAVPDHMTIIFVGDIDQLPSVGAGNVLRDIIDSGSFTVVRLMKIFRQAETSKIITNAHKINKGLIPDISNSKETDFFFMDIEKEAKKQGIMLAASEDMSEFAAGKIIELATKRMPGFLNVNVQDVQILTPMKRGVLGTEILNQSLQNAINPIKGNHEIRHGFTSYRPGDKVMHIKNNYDKQVFNGDVGTVKKIDMYNDCLVVDYDGHEVEYDKQDLDELVLAYAVTIHKSQGSEYPVVIIPVMMSHYIMLQRNLIYTGVTRAKKGIILVGTRKALARSVKHITVNKRNTMLKERIQYLWQ